MKPTCTNSPYEQELLRELAALRSENTRLQKEWNTCHAANEDLVKRHLDTQRQLAEAREALERYGSHDVECPYMPNRFDCTCGFLRSPTPAAESAQPKEEA